MVAKVAPQFVLQGIKDELKKVEWPSKKEALHLTLVVVIISILLGIYIGFFDFIFAKLISLLITQ